jgi:hypothetical protein
MAIRGPDSVHKIKKSLRNTGSDLALFIGRQLQSAGEA